MSNFTNCNLITKNTLITNVDISNILVTNTSSNIYYIGHINSGKIRSNFSTGVTIGAADKPKPYQFNSSYIMNRNKTYNEITNWIGAIRNNNTQSSILDTKSYFTTI